MSKGSKQSKPYTLDWPHRYNPSEPLPEKIQVYLDEYLMTIVELHETENLEQDSFKALDRTMPLVNQGVGKALHEAQQMEQLLALILIGNAGLSGEITTEAEKKIFLEELDFLPCGKLIKLMQKHVLLTGNAKNLLSRALKARNSLAHGFYIRGHPRLLRIDGRREMMAELCEYMRLFQQVGEMLDQLVEHMIAIGGVNNDARLAMYDQLQKEVISIDMPVQ